MSNMLYITKWFRVFVKYVVKEHKEGQDCELYTGADAFLRLVKPVIAEISNK